ncbi:hypothetical protein PHET_01309 [Paragonimus heterotremus]|uniref:Uncharacterized protein n=1 Tax=Paragonimus heterotremus TaxID=100268 RepID=A0A8J4T5R2_9TREM|nr:hypothetical protein PHET_01309 [Paragonimus heterotremus]
MLNDNWILKMCKFDLILLDHAAYDVMASTLIAHHHNSLKMIETFKPESGPGIQTTAFVLFSPADHKCLERISYICDVLHLSDAFVFTRIPANANSEVLESVMEGPEYPNTAVKFNSKRFGSINLNFERLPFFGRLTFSDIITVSRFHEFGHNFDNASGAFQDLNLLLWSVDVLEEVYSIGRLADLVASQFASAFTPATERKKYLVNSKEKKYSASVIFVSDLALHDPVACIEPYMKPSHLLDLVFAELSPDGHCVKVCWDTLSHFSPQSIENVDDTGNEERLAPFYTDLLQTSNLGLHPWLSRQVLLKEQEALTTLQTDLLAVAHEVNHPLPELSKVPQNKSQWASLFGNQVMELYGPVCKSGKLELLNAVQLAKACGLALSNYARRLRSEPGVASSESGVNLEKLLARFERSLLVASQLDAKALSQLEEPTKCEPILLHALREAKNLPYLDDRFLLVVHLISLLPVNSSISQSVWNVVQELFDSGKRTRDHSNRQANNRGVLIPTHMTTTRLISNLKTLREERRKLPSYNNLWTTQPRYRSPLVQMMRDLVAARSNPEDASPALKGLTHHAHASGAAKWLSGLSRYIRMPGSTGSNTVPYNTDYVILVVLGSLPFALARDLFETVKTTSSTSPTMKLKIVASRFTGGFHGLSGFFQLPD